MAKGWLLGVLLAGSCDAAAGEGGGFVGGDWFSPVLSGAWPWIRRDILLDGGGPGGGRGVGGSLTMVA